MAHNLRIHKIPLRTKDGNLRPGKYNYEVRCKHRQCRSKPVHVATSEARALAFLENGEHHLRVRIAYEAASPNDLAFLRTNRNKTKKAERMAKLRG